MFIGAEQFYLFWQSLSDRQYSLKFEKISQGELEKLTNMATC